jgi:hypothetical protein
MVKKRSRRKHTTTLEDRLLKFTADLQEKVKTCHPGTDEAVSMRRRIRQSEAALRFNTSLNAGK